MYPFKAETRRLPVHLRSYASIQGSVCLWLRWLIRAVRLLCSCAQASFAGLCLLPARGAVALRPVGSSRIRGQARALCTGREILTRCASREVPPPPRFRNMFTLRKILQPLALTPHASLSSPLLPSPGQPLICSLYQYLLVSIVWFLDSDFN